MSWRKMRGRNAVWDWPKHWSVVPPADFDAAVAASYFVDRTGDSGCHMVAGKILYHRHMQSDSTPRLLLAAVAAVLLWSAIGCHDAFTWFLEVAPALIGVPLLIWLYPRLRFTNLVYALIAVHAAILMIGGHYTYSLMPVFQWIKEWLHLDRNYYDRLGHFAQGFVPAFIAREVLLRTTRLERGKMLAYLVFSCCMAISAMYELFEFAVARATGASADAFLGTQGDVWDTQWDMTWCLIGATCMLLFFTGIHDRAMARLNPPAARP